jgi:hypothetical protein
MGWILMLCQGVIRDKKNLGLRSTSSWMSCGSGWVFCRC